MTIVEELTRTAGVLSVSDSTEDDVHLVHLDFPIDSQRLTFDAKLSFQTFTFASRLMLIISDFARLILFRIV